MPATKTSSPKQGDHVMKYFKFGLEFEVFTLDQKGYVINAAEQIIKRVQEKAPHVNITKEAGRNMVELGTNPHVDFENVMTATMKDFETLLYHADKEGVIIYPYSTYPGDFTPAMNDSKGYLIKESIFGKRRWRIAGRCVGMHCHYTLPWGVFDSDTKTIKSLTYSKNKQSLVNIYNLFIAMDPALTTFTQSSPFYQGHHLGKNCRMIAYRGGYTFNNPQGLYANLPKYGALQQYETTGTDLVHIIKRRFRQWGELVAEHAPNTEVASKHGSILDTTWNPVKINAHGTMEQRGMDMNTPQVISAVALIIKYLAREVQAKYVEVLPSDMGILEPFKYNGESIIIPPHTYVRHYLQARAAFEGLENPDVLNYCSALLKLAHQLIPTSRHEMLEPLAKMLKEKKTTSDRILDTAKKVGYKPGVKLSRAHAAELALALSRDFYREIILTRQALENLGE